MHTTCLPFCVYVSYTSQCFLSGNPLPLCLVGMIDEDAQSDPSSAYIPCQRGIMPLDTCMVCGEHDNHCEVIRLPHILGGFELNQTWIHCSKDTCRIDCQRSAMAVHIVDRRLPAFYFSLQPGGTVSVPRSGRTTTLGAQHGYLQWKKGHLVIQLVWGDKQQYWKLVRLDNLFRVNPSRTLVVGCVPRAPAIVGVHYPPGMLEALETYQQHLKPHERISAQ
jgi:hypothetical protein